MKSQRELEGVLDFGAWSKCRDPQVVVYLSVHTP